MSRGAPAPGSRSTKLPGRAEIIQADGKFLAAVKKKEDTTTRGEGLYRLVLEPVMDSTIFSLIVVPDGSLHLVPFEALLRKMEQPMFAMGREATLTAAKMRGGTGIEGRDSAAAFPQTAYSEVRPVTSLRLNQLHIAIQIVRAR